MFLPFRAIFYNSDAISSWADVISPPYDVISPDLQKKLFAKSPYNFCRLDLPEETGAARYEKAQKIWQNWLAEKILIQDKLPALYLHRHSFYLESGQKVARLGFFAACLLEDFSAGKILPHEKTLDAPKQDRLEMMHATAAQLSPVFSLYDDPQNSIESLFASLRKTTPFCDFTTEDSERHEIWKVQNPDILKQFEKLWRNQLLFIADGHHRYETALNYRNEVLARHPDLPAEAAARFILMYCVNLNDSGLVILPIHRCLHSLPNFSIAAVVQNLERTFDVKTFPQDLWQQARQEQADLAHTHHAFLLIPSLTDSENIFLISLSHAKGASIAQERGWPSALAGLDVTVLHQEILQNQLGISEADLAAQTFLDYEKSTDAALARVQNGSAQLAFLMNPTRIEQMQHVAEAGLKMPQKSTFFYPKIASGLIVHSVEAKTTDG